MVIGSVLLQPQRLERAAQIPDDEGVLDDIFNLALLLGRDGLEAGLITGALAASLSGTVERFAAQTGAGIASAVSRFEALFQPLIQPVESMIAEPPDDASQVVQAVEAAAQNLITALQNLSPPQLRAQMDEVFDILEADLGITPSFVDDLVYGLLDDMLLALQSAPPGEIAAQRSRRRAVSGLLSRIRRRLAGLFSFPGLNADDAAQALLALLDRPEVSEALTRAACSGEAAAAYFRAGQALVDLLPYSGFPAFGSGGMGAAAAPTEREQICWYASKLLEYDNVDGDLGKLPLPATTTLLDGTLSQEWRDAFRHASVVLARSAFAYVEEADKEWTVIDRKKYVIHRVNTGTFFVYRLFEMSESDFLGAIADDKSKLREAFRKNGINLPASITVVHQEGSNLWEIDSFGVTYRAFKFAGTITIHPRSLATILFELRGDFETELNAKTLSTALRQLFEAQGIPLTPKASIDVRDPGTQWLLDDNEYEYSVEKDGGKFEVSMGNFWGWLRSTIGKPKGDLVWINRERTQVLLGQRILHVGTDVSWEDAPIFKRINGNRHYSLRNAAATLEDWAYYTSWIKDGVDIGIHGVKIGKSIADNEVEYSITSNSFNTARLFSEMIIKLAQKRPMSEVVGIGFWYDLILDAVDIIIKVIEGAVGPTPPPDPATSTANDFSKFIDKVLGAVFGVEIADTHWSDLLYEFTLSLLTLINHLEPEQASQERPENYQESGGFVDLFWHTSLIVYAAAVPDDEYALPFQTVPLTLGYWLGGALGVGLVSGFLGHLVAQGAVAKMNVFADGKQLGKIIGKSSGMSLVYFWSYLKLVKGKA